MGKSFIKPRGKKVQFDGSADIFSSAAAQKEEIPAAPLWVCLE